MTPDTIDLIARVLAWQDGWAFTEIPDAPTLTHYRDHAQQCAEDLGLTGTPTRPAQHAAFCWCDGCQGLIPHPGGPDA